VVTGLNADALEDRIDRALSRSARKG
jgi:hypothetical protein